MKRIILLLSVVFLLIGCGGEKEPEVKDTLVVAQGGDPKTLDPAMYNDVPSLTVAKQIYSTLILMDENKELIPSLAESWEKVSETEYVFNLRKGVKFHNGAELKSHDVQYSIMRMKEEPGSQAMVEAVESVEVVDEYTVKVVLSKPFSPLLYNLTHPLCSILNKGYTEEVGKEIGAKPMGTGPFVFKTWDKGSLVTLESFDDYFGGKPAFENLLFKAIPENSNRVIGLETGEIDIAYDISPVDVEAVEKDKDLQLVMIPSLSTEYMGINVESGIFKDKRVRQALNYAVNREDIVEVTVNGRGIVADTFVSPNVYGSNQELHRYGFDPEKARELLKEAGIAEGTKVKIWTNENPLRISSSQIIQANLKEIGLEASIDILEWGSYVQRTGNGEHELFILGWNAGTGDADNAIYPLFHSASKGGAGNRSFYVNERVDGLIDESRVLQGEERKEYLLDAQEAIIEDAPIVPLYYKNIIIGINKDIKNFVPKGSGHHVLEGIKFETIQ